MLSRYLHSGKRWADGTYMLYSRRVPLEREVHSILLQRMGGSSHYTAASHGATPYVASTLCLQVLFLELYMGKA